MVTGGLGEACEMAPESWPERHTKVQLLWSKIIVTPFLIQSFRCGEVVVECLAMKMDIDPRSIHLRHSINCKIFSGSSPLNKLFTPYSQVSRPMIAVNNSLCSFLESDFFSLISRYNPKRVCWIINAVFWATSVAEGSRFCSPPVAVDYSWIIC